MLTSPTSAIRRPVLRDWGAAGLVAFLCLALAAVAFPHALRSGGGVGAVVMLLGTAAVLGWYARPRRLQPEALTRALEALSRRGPLTLQLTAGAGGGIGRAGLAYAAIARLDGARLDGARSDAVEVVLAQADEPAQVLAVARYWQRQLGVPLLPGWGLTKAELDALDAKRGVSHARLSYAGPSQHGAGGAVVALACSAIAVLALAGSVAIFRAPPTSLMSLVLLGVGVGLLVLLAAATRSDRTSLVVQEAFEVERRCLGFSLAKLQLPLEELRLLSVVSPGGRHARHLLVGSNQGFWAIECPAKLAPALRDPVVALRTPLSSPSPQQEAPQEERAPRVMSGSGHH